MTEARYHELSAYLLDLARQIEDSKRPAYTVGSPDVLHNFVSVATRAGISPMQAWAVYFLKHIDAITALAKDRTIPQAEAIEGRFADAINYLKLEFALSQETGWADALQPHAPRTLSLFDEGRAE
jgi:hypothetical protein